nr:TM2 domain-containing protein [Candidatus Prometheoarchaeum syntrophicum]
MLDNNLYYQPNFSNKTNISIVLISISTFLGIIWWIMKYNKADKEYYLNIFHSSEYFFKKTLLSLSMTEKNILINDLAIFFKLQPKKGKKITMKLIEKGYIVGKMEESTWKLYIGDNIPAQTIVNKNPNEFNSIKSNVDNSALNQTFVDNYPNSMNSNNSISGKTLPKKNVAGVLAIFFGDLGIHRFYMGDFKRGIICLCLSFTIIPGIIGFIEGIIILSETQNDFERRLAKINSL